MLYFYVSWNNNILYVTLAITKDSFIEIVHLFYANPLNLITIITN